MESSSTEHKDTFDSVFGPVEDTIAGQNMSFEEEMEYINKINIHYVCEVGFMDDVIDPKYPMIDAAIHEFGKSKEDYI